MLTQNNDVPQGQANGSRLFVKRIKAIPGKQPHTMKLDCGTTINALFASQVKSIVLEQENSDIMPQVFEVEAKSWTFKTSLEIADSTIKVSLRGSQFPIISNSCTTGHKLQGCSLDEILVNDWCYQSNWAYVVLSRVRKMSGLYIRDPLTFDLKKYKKNQKLQDMLNKFGQSILIADITEAEYHTMIIDTEECKD